MRLQPVHLQLETYAFTNINIGPNEYFFKAAADGSNLRPINIDDIEADLVTLQEPDESNNLMIELKIYTTPNIDTKNVRAKFSITALAGFVMPADMLADYLADEKTKLAIVANCAAILYGATREQLHSLSCKMPFGLITLPTCSFNNISIQKTEPDAEAKPKKTPKKKTAKA